MRFKTIKLCAVTLMTLVASAASRAEIVFVGYGSISGVYTFVLRESAASPSGWFALGDRFGDYMLSAFDAEKRELLLTKGEESLRLKLREATIRESPRNWDPGRRDELNRLLHDMLPPQGRGRIFEIGDYIAVASSYGLVITARKSDGRVEEIEMAAPPPVSGEEAATTVKTTKFRVQLPGRKGGPAQSLRITF